MDLVTIVASRLPRPTRRRIITIPYYLDVIRRMRGRMKRECPLCGYKGRFTAWGHPPRYDAECKRCGSLERHRLIKMVIDRDNLIPDGASVIHFAPEPIIGKLISHRTSYRTADIREGRADLVLNIEQLELSDNEIDVFIANHVLEHVNDAKAMPELFRALKPGGVLIVTIPIVEGWDGSYENPEITTPAGRAIHFGRFDHVRQFGRDFRDRLRAAGFVLDEYAADGADCVRYSLLPGERVFIARKPAAANIS